MTGFLFVTSYATMVVAALFVEGAFALFGWTPSLRHASVVSASISWNYTSVLDLVFGALGVLLVVVFASTGGPKMMRHMAHMDGESSGDGHGHAHAYAHAHHG